jgi:hypothetical protein
MLVAVGLEPARLQYAAGWWFPTHQQQVSSHLWDSALQVQLHPCGGCSHHPSMKDSQRVSLGLEANSSAGDRMLCCNGAWQHSMCQVATTVCCEDLDSAGL